MRLFIYIIIGFLLFGCGNSERPSKPDNLIPKEKMSDILYDVFVLNSAKGINKRILEQNGVFPQEYVYKKYNIDSLQFAQSNDYYSYDTKTYEAIITTVKERLEREKQINEALVVKEEKVKDSLREIQVKLKDSLKETLILVDSIPGPQVIESKLLNRIPKLDTTLIKKKKQKQNVFGQEDN